MNRIRVIFILLISLIILTAFSLSTKDRLNKRILVSFEVEGKGQMDIGNSFTIDFISDSITYNSEVKDCALKIPNFTEKIKNISVEFRFENYTLKFSDVKTDWLNLSQKMNWNFKVDLPPFDELQNETLSKEGLKMIYYFQLNPVEYGEGIEIINPIY